jgi:polysaccharide export outer membrane protein
MDFARFSRFESRPHLIVAGSLILTGLLLAASDGLRAQSGAPPPAQAPGAVEISALNNRATSVAPSSAATAGGNTAAPAINSVSAPAGYQLMANDQIGVEVFGEDDLRTASRLTADGAVSLPLLGSVRHAGLTLAQAAARLTELYGRDYLINPKVNVVLIGYAKQRFTMLGQVNRPGSYEMPDGADGIDILEAVAIAGGYTRIAAPEKISIRRRGTRGDQMLRVNAKKLGRQGGTFHIQSGDTITVGESIF